jgi:hypothetical protein
MVFVALPLNFLRHRDVVLEGQEALALSKDGHQRTASSVEGRMTLRPKSRDHG